MTAEDLLAQSGRISPGSPQAQRQLDISNQNQRLFDAIARVEDEPLGLLRTINSETRASPECVAFARGKVARVLLTNVKHAFLEASLAHPRSSLRAEKLQKMRKELDQIRPLGGRLSPEMQSELHHFEVDAEALAAVAQARGLREQAKACVATLRPPSRPSSRVDLHSMGALSEDLQEDRDKDAERSRIVAQAIEMLRRWKGHSEVAHSLCDALLWMAETVGEEFRLEMEKQGLGVLASTVVDLHSDRADVARSGLRLLSFVSIELLIGTIEESLGSESIVTLGLEVVNKLVREDPCALDEVATYGGRELADLIEPKWGSSRMVALHLLNFRRRLRRSKAKSVRKQRPEVPLPPEDVVKLRKCFEELDDSKCGSIGIQKINKALLMTGLKLDPFELEAAVKEVDVDHSGTIEWPEFLWLMSRAEANIENLFSEDRLAEMREVFSLFDADGNGSLDTKELGAVMRNIGLCPSDFELRAMIAEVDADGTGAIEWQEFLHLMSRKVVDPDNQHMLAFQFFDRDNSGTIDREEFVKTMLNMQKMSEVKFTRKELETMFIESKFENRDLSTLTYKEFVKMMMRT